MPGGGPSWTACGQAGQSITAEAALACPSSSPTGFMFTATLPANAAAKRSAFAVIAATGRSDRAGQAVACDTPDEVLKRFSIGLLKSRRQAAEREIRL